MDLEFRSNNLKCIIGNIRDYNRVENSILKEDPYIIIIAAALKHIDKCEYAVNECIMTNLMAPQARYNAPEVRIWGAD